MAGPARWLLLIHQIPPRPTALRVKIWRRLQRLGAIALKSSVYVLPASAESREDFEWVRREIAEAGADATLCEATFVEGITDGQLEAMFRAARDAEYAHLLRESRALRPKLDASAVARVLRRFEEVQQRDFFGAKGRAELERRLARLEPRQGIRQAPAMRGRTWVTREGIHVDRMASAWLIRRFIDPKAKLRFVDARAYRHRRGELRFDMYEGEFTHVGDACTFEVLQRRYVPKDRALRRIGELVHDLDVKDEKFGREETRGFGQTIAAIAAAHPTDPARLERAAAVLDDLYSLFSSQQEAHR
jgi:hypothetical protein